MSYSRTVTDHAAGRPSTAHRVVVATDDGLSDTNGDRVGLTGRSVTAIALDGAATWALTERTTLHRVDDDAERAVADLPGPVGGWLHVHRDTVLVGGDDAGLWRLEGDELEPVASFADAPTRSEWYTPWGGPPAVFSMASLADDLYVAVHVGGILHSDDGGQTWSPTIDLHDDVHQVVVDPADGTVWAATGRRGLAESRDRGRSWTFHHDGLHATYALAAAATADGVLVSVSSGHGARDGAVHRLEDGVLLPVEGLPEPLGRAIGPGGLAAHGTTAAAATPVDGLYVSDDGGRSWAPSPPPSSSVRAVAVG